MTAPTGSEGPLGDDPIRERLLDAAAAVFARQGFDGTRILDIVKEAGLSTGAIYGRFGSKQELLREAVVRRSSMIASSPDSDERRVAEIVARGARIVDAPLTDSEAVMLEAYVAARREPEVAKGLAEAREARLLAVAPYMDKAIKDGTLREDVDPGAVMFFLRVIRLGTLLHRGAGLPMPEPDAWDSLIAGMVASFGQAARDGDD